MQDIKLDAKELRLSEPTDAQIAKIKRRKVFIVCDNVLDTYNIGSIFRLADAVAAARVYLCRDSEFPPNIKIKRAAVGTDKWVPWKRAKDAKEGIYDIRKIEPAVKVVAIEQAEGSKNFKEVSYTEPVAFVIGHETDGVDPETIKACDEVVELPMLGVNKSLNVMVSLAVVLFNSLKLK